MDKYTVEKMFKGLKAAMAMKRPLTDQEVREAVADGHALLAEFMDNLDSLARAANRFEGE